VSNFFRRITRSFDIFSLGNSIVTYLLAIFFVLPIGIFLGAPSRIGAWFFSTQTSALSFSGALLVLFGLIAFILGYWFFDVFIKRKKMKIPTFSLENKWNDSNVFLVFLFLFFLNLVVKGLRIYLGWYVHTNTLVSIIKNGLYSFIGILDWVGPVALCIAFGYYFFLYRNKEKKYVVWKYLAWGVFCLEFFYGFLSLSRFRAMVPILVYLIVRHYILKKSIARVFVVGLMMLFLVIPAMNVMRSPAGFFEGYEIPSQEKTILHVTEYIFDSAAGRIDQSRILKNLLESHNILSYGGVFKNLAISLTPPRIFWEEKPVINGDGNEFGRKIGILNPEDKTTSIAPTMLGDWYLNFGMLGVVGGMFFMGGLLRFIYDVLIVYSRAALSGVMIYSIVWIQVIKGMEDWIAPVYAGLVKLLVVLLAVHILLTSDFSRFAFWRRNVRQ